MKLNYTILIYDIETKHSLKARIWRPGEQRVGHEQLDAAAMEDGIICIAYKWYGEKEVHVLEGPSCVEEFDKVARQADVCLGKNSDRFDVKHINTQRMLQGLKPYPEWMDTNDDLEKQLRKYFTFPSYSLDYVSKLMGFGGKVKMERQDWIDIDNYEVSLKLYNGQDFSVTQKAHLCKLLFKDVPRNIKLKGIAALQKMMFYNKKDVEDTENVLKKVMPYIKLKHNAATNNAGKGCIACGSMNIIQTKVIIAGKTKYQQFECLDHKGYAGRATWHYKKGSHSRTYGTMG